MRLKTLLKELPDIQVRPFKDLEITGVTSNSKLVCPGNIFIAKKGIKSDGAHFIPEAISHGAFAIATDIYDPTLTNCVQLIHPDIDYLQRMLASHFFQKPSEELWMVAVTGTCGKTTTSFAIKHMLEQNQLPCGLIGSIEYVVGKKRYLATHTTPDVCSNQKLLRQMCQENCTACVMEVTSHALQQARVSEIEFDIAVFTNLTHEHLDYHGTMENYFRAKAELFRLLKANKKSKKSALPKIALINADDPYKERLIACTAPGAHIVTYAINKMADLMASDITYGRKGTDFMLNYRGCKTPIHWPLVGKFNVYNALACIGVGLYRGLPLEAIAQSLATFQNVPGRLDPVENRLGLHIFVDYAHKPEALRNICKTLKELSTRKLIVVFGCGGDRDREKRPIMGKIAEELAHIAIITSDNPRNEDPQKIAQEVLAGFLDPKKAIVELDRRKAIEKAISLAEPQDIIVLAGKGHETKQLFSHISVEFDDKVVARDICESIYHKKILQMAGKK